MRNQSTDFTRLKLVQGKKEVEMKREAKQKEAENAMILASGQSLPRARKTNDEDITAAFDVTDDEDVVF